MLHCMILMTIILTQCREFSERLTILLMIQMIKNYIYEHIDEWTSMKNICLVSVTVIAIVLLFANNRLMNRNIAAMKYIHELEETIEADGTVVGDVCGGDGYAEWYGGM